MNIIDLREFQFKIGKIISFDDNGFIFNNAEYYKKVYKRYFYKYNLEDKHIHRINKKGIDTCESVYSNNYVLNDYIYTNSSYTLQHDITKNFMCRVNLTDGEIDILYSTEKDVTFTFISDRYLLVHGNNYEMNEKHSDPLKYIQGDYDYTILCDLLAKKEYEIKDKRVIWGVRDYFIPYTSYGKSYIVFEEAYMEDYELEEAFKEGILKTDFYKNGYRESINIISLDKFVKSVQNGFEIIPFNQIHKTELTSWTRYFGMDDDTIYYRVKDFDSNILSIYSINKKTSEKKLLKSIQMNNSEFSFSNYSLWYDNENRKIYETKIIDDNSKEVKELMYESFDLKYEAIREDFEGVIENYFITSYWTEDDNGDHYKSFVKVKDTNNATVDIYEGVCTIIKDNIIFLNNKACH